MKNNCLLVLIGLFMVVCLIGGCSGGGSEEIPSPPPVVEKDYVNVTTDSIHSTIQGGDFSFTITTNQSWSASSNQSWCTISKLKGEKGSHTIVVTIGTCTEWEDRKATIVLKAGNAQETITITQERAFQLQVTCENEQVDYAGGTVSVKVKSNVQFEISCQTTWIKQVKTSTSKQEQTFQFQVEANETENKREGEISFYNEEKKLRQSIVIQQEGKPEDTSVKPSGNIGYMTWG